MNPMTNTISAGMVQEWSAPIQQTLPKPYAEFNPNVAPSDVETSYKIPKRRDLPNIVFDSKFRFPYGAGCLSETVISNKPVWPGLQRSTSSLTSISSFATFWSSAKDDDEAGSEISIDNDSENESEGATTWVRTRDDLENFLPNLMVLEKGAAIPQIYCDCEGVDLSRFGSLTHLQMTIPALRHTWIFVMKKLGPDAFNLIGDEKQSIKGTLESEDFMQGWFDPRADADALRGHFGISIGLGKVRDIQMMEMMTRRDPRFSVRALKRCMDDEGLAFMTPAEHKAWLESKVNGKSYFAVNGYSVLETDPLPGLAKQYIAGDTPFLSALHHIYAKRMNGNQSKMDLVDRESMKQAQVCWSPLYDPRVKCEYPAQAPTAFRNLPLEESQKDDFDCSKHDCTLEGFESSWT